MNKKKLLFLIIYFFENNYSSFDVKKAEILIGFISSLFEIPANDYNIEHTDLALQSIDMFQSNLKEIVKLKNPIKKSIRDIAIKIIGNKSKVSFKAAMY